MKRSERSSQIWVVLAWVARNRQSITYSQLASLTGLPRAALGQMLDPIHVYCANGKLPPLTILVVQQESGLPGSGFTGVSASQYAKAQMEVFEFDWLAHGNPQPQAFE